MLWYVAIIAAINLGLGIPVGGVRASVPPLRQGPRDGSVAARAVGRPLEHGAANPSRAVAAAAELLRRAAPAARTRPATTSSATPSTNESAPLDPATGLVTREHAEQLLTKLHAADASQSPLTVALVEMAPLDWAGQSRRRRDRQAHAVRRFEHGAAIARGRAHGGPLQRPAAAGRRAARGRAASHAAGRRTAATRGDDRVRRRRPHVSNDGHLRAGRSLGRADRAAAVRIPARSAGRSETLRRQPHVHARRQVRRRRWCPPNCTSRRSSWRSRVAGVERPRVRHVMSAS